MSATSIQPNPKVCPCCSCEEGRVLLRDCEDLLHGVAGRWSLIECANCGLVRTDPIPRDDQIPALYPDDYGPHHRGFKPLGRSGLGAILRQIAVSPYTVRFGRPGIACAPFGARRFLDVGCGAGSLLREMVDAGWCGTGLDLSETAVAEARAAVPEASFHVGALASSALMGPYDLIAMQHVLEHVPRPTECLRKCFDLLSPGGVLVIAVPNIDSLEAFFLKRHWVGLDLPRHLVHFPEPVLVRTLQTCGYEVVRRRPQMFASSISESLQFFLPARLRRRVRKSAAARLFYLSLVFPACVSYLFGNRGAVEVFARRPA